MPQRCSICIHPQRDAINAALLAGEPLRAIAGRFGTSRPALQRHKAEHLPVKLAEAQAAAEAARADSLLDQVRALQAKTLGILDKAERAGDLRTAIAAIREARGNVDLLARLAGELRNETTVNVALAATPEWSQLRALILRAVEPFPDARLALAEALNADR
jgi:hypothetical protein